MRRIATGAYRESRLAIPTRVLYGPAEPAVVREIYGGCEAYTDDLAVEPIEGAAHCLRTNDQIGSPTGSSPSSAHREPARRVHASSAT
jgi:hypothetical protein